MLAVLKQQITPLVDMNQMSKTSLKIQGISRLENDASEQCLLHKKSENVRSPVYAPYKQ